MKQAMIAVAVIVTCAAALVEQGSTGSAQVQPETTGPHPQTLQDDQAWIDKLWYIQRDWPQLGQCREAVHNLTEHRRR